MKRTTIVIDDKLLEAIEAQYGELEYLNLSAIMRDLTRKALKTEQGGHND